MEKGLVEDGFVLRYRTTDDGSVDGLTGREGAFLACSFWLVDCLHMIGRKDDAEELFARLLALRNDLGLLSEEYDPVDGRLVGNFPQAFSHVSLVNSAYRLTGRDAAGYRNQDGRPHAATGRSHHLHAPGPVGVAEAEAGPYRQASRRGTSLSRRRPMHHRPRGRTP